MTNRRPRYSRTRPAALSPTEDDRLIARHLAEHRLLRSSHLYDLLGRPADKIVRRLAALYHNGYLERPRAQRQLLDRGSNPPLIYALGRKAAQLFGEPDGLDWSATDPSITHPYMAHTLMIADVMVAFELAIRRRKTMRLLRAREIAAHAYQATGREPRSWTMHAETADGIAISATPDKVFGIEYLDTGRRSYFVLEADRATMPVSRSSLDQSSYAKKMLAYFLGHQAKRHTGLWGMPGFRVLTVTKSEERIATMVEAQKLLTSGKGSNVFLFAQLTDVLGGDPTTFLWLSGKEQSIQLVQ